MTNKEYYIKTLELQVDLFKGRLEEAQQVFDELEDILVHVENIFAGWSNDECWTDYDEKTRQRLIEFRKKHTYKDTSQNAVGVEKRGQKINTNHSADEQSDAAAIAPMQCYAGEAEPLPAKAYCSECGMAVNSSREQHYHWCSLAGNGA